MGNKQSNKIIEKSQTNISTKNKQMNNSQIDQALIELLYSAIKLIKMRTECNSNYNSSSDSDYKNSESEGDSESETDESMPDLISDSENNLDSQSETGDSDLISDSENNLDSQSETGDSDSDYNDLPKSNINNEDCNEQTKVSDYTVYKKGDVYKCTCKHFIYRIGNPVIQSKGCKHILNLI